MPILVLQLIEQRCAHLVRAFSITGCISSWGGTHYPEHKPHIPSGVGHAVASHPKAYSVRSRIVCPGRSITGSNPGSFAASGKCCVSKHSAQCCRPQYSRVRCLACFAPQNAVPVHVGGCDSKSCPCTAVPQFERHALQRIHHSNAHTAVLYLDTGLGGADFHPTATSRVRQPENSAPVTTRAPSNGCTSMGK